MSYKKEEDEKEEGVPNEDTGEKDFDGDLGDDLADDFDPMLDDLDGDDDFGGFSDGNDDNY